MKILETINAPQPIGPYVQAMMTNGIVYVSGMLPINPQSGQIEATTTSEMTEQIIKNIEAVLAEAGSTLRDIIKTTIYLTDMNDFAEMNTVYATYFAEHKPARTCIAVKALPLKAKIEVEVIARSQI